MILVLTNSNDITANYLIDKIKRNNNNILRINTDTVVSKATFLYKNNLPYLKFDDLVIASKDVAVVWYRRPERLANINYSNTDEGCYLLDEWTVALEGFFAHIPPSFWINYPFYNTAASNKIEQLSIAKQLGLKIPATLVTQNPDQARLFIKDCKGVVVVKPLSRGLVKRNSKEADSLIYANILRQSDENGFFNLPNCPTLFQKLIKKREDVRITVVDANIHSVSLSLLNPDNCGCDIRRDNMKDVKYSIIDLPRNIKSKIMKLINHYRLRFAAIDMILSDSGEWYFIEINPNGQWAWLDIHGKTNIYQSFISSFGLD